jgi:hypothetical protein
MLTVGQNHVAGTFLGFFLSEAVGITISVVMLRGRVFGPVNATTGILGFAFLLIYDVASSFVPGASEGVLMVATVGGLLNVAWMILTARRLFVLGRDT